MTDWKLKKKQIGSRLLLVEDSAVLVMDLEEILEQEGYVVVGPAGSIDTAECLLEQEDIDGALLDIDVHGEDCFELAAKLRARRKPVAFLTGFSKELAVPPNFQDCPCFEKPFYPEELLAGLSELLNPTSADQDGRRDGTTDSAGTQSEKS